MAPLSTRNDIGAIVVASVEIQPQMPQSPPPTSKPVTVSSNIPQTGVTHVPTQISARIMEGPESVNYEHDDQSDQYMPKIQLQLDHQPISITRPDRNMLQVFESTSDVGNPQRYPIVSESPNILSSINESSSPNLEENIPKQTENDYFEVQQFKDQNQILSGSFQHTKDIYDQLIDGDISEQDGGLIDEEPPSAALKLRTENLVLEKIDEEQQSEESEAIYRQKHQSAPIDSPPNPSKAVLDKTRTTTVQNVFKDVNDDISPLVYQTLTKETNESKQQQAADENKTIKIMQMDTLYDMANDLLEEVVQVETETKKPVADLENFDSHVEVKVAEQDLISILKPENVATPILKTLDWTTDEQILNLGNQLVDVTPVQLKEVSEAEQSQAQLAVKEKSIEKLKQSLPLNDDIYQLGKQHLNHQEKDTKLILQEAIEISQISKSSTKIEAIEIVSLKSQITNKDIPNDQDKKVEETIQEEIKSQYIVAEEQSLHKIKPVSGEVQKSDQSDHTVKALKVNEEKSDHQSDNIVKPVSVKEEQSEKVVKPVSVTEQQSNHMMKPLSVKEEEKSEKTQSSNKQTNSVKSSVKKQADQSLETVQNQTKNINELTQVVNSPKQKFDSAMQKLKILQVIKPAQDQPKNSQDPHPVEVKTEDQEAKDTPTPIQNLDSYAQKNKEQDQKLKINPNPTSVAPTVLPLSEPPILMNKTDPIEPDSKQKFQSAMEALRQLKKDKMQKEKSASLPLEPVSPVVKSFVQTALETKLASQVKKALTQQDLSPTPQKKETNIIDKLRTGLVKKLEKVQSRREWQEIPSRPTSVLQSEKSSGSPKKPSLKNRLKAAVKKKIAEPIKLTDEQRLLQEKLANGPSKEELVRKISEAKMIADQLKEQAVKINKIFKREDYLRRLEVPGEQLLMRQQDEDLLSCFTPKNELMVDEELKLSIDVKSEALNKNPKLRRFDSVTDGEQSQIRVDLARIVQRQPLYEQREPSQYTEVVVSQNTQIELVCKILDMPYENQHCVLDLSEFKRPLEEQKFILQVNYPNSKIDSDKVYFSTDCTEILNSVKKIDHLVFWEYQRNHSCKNIHIQWMMREESLAQEADKLQPTTFQNYYSNGRKLVQALNWDLPNKSQIPGCQIVEGFPVLLNQVLYIQGSSLKVYSLRNRYFQLGDDMILTQMELSKLKPEFAHLDHYDFSSLFQQIIEQLMKTKRPSEFHFQLVFLQFAFKADMAPQLVKLETGYNESIKLDQDVMTTLLFKLDKRVRQLLKMRPNNLMKNEKVFKKLWHRITPSEDEVTQLVKAKVASAFKLEEASSCTETAKPYDGMSIGSKSDNLDLSVKLITVGKKQNNQPEMSVTSPAKSYTVEIPKQRNTRYQPEIVIIPSSKVATIQSGSPLKSYGQKYQLIEIQEEEIIKPLREDRNNKREQKYDQLDFMGADNRKTISTFKGGNTDQKLGTVSPIILPDRQIFGRALRKDQATSALKHYKDAEGQKNNSRTSNYINISISDNKAEPTDASYHRAPFTSKLADQSYGFFAMPSPLSTEQEESFYTQSIRKLDLQKAQLRQINGIGQKNVAAPPQKLVIEQHKSVSSNPRYVDVSPLNQTLDAGLLSPRTLNQGDIWRRKRSEQPSSDRLLLPDIGEYQFGQNEWFVKAMLQKSARNSRPY